MRAGTGDETARLCDGYRAQEPGLPFRRVFRRRQAFDL